MKEKVKVRGKFRLYLQWPLYLSALFIIMGLFVGLVSVKAGIIVSSFTKRSKIPAACAGGFPARSQKNRALPCNPRHNSVYHNIITTFRQWPGTSRL